MASARISLSYMPVRAGSLEDSCFPCPVGVVPVVGASCVEVEDSLAGFTVPKISFVDTLTMTVVYFWACAPLLYNSLWAAGSVP